MEAKNLPSNEAMIAHESRLATEMAQLHVLGHNALQSARYEATREEYLQAMVDRQWRDYCIPPPKKNYLTSG